MILDKAQKIKKRLLIFEDKQLEPTRPKVWKILICDKEVNVAELIEECKRDYKADDISAALHYRESFEIYVVYKEGDSYPFELYEQFLSRNNLVL